MVARCCPSASRELSAHRVHRATDNLAAEQALFAQRGFLALQVIESQLDELGKLEERPLVRELA